MLALSVIDTIVGIDKQGNWLFFHSAKGCLRHMVESLAQNEQSLQESLQPSPELLRVLFIYESQMVSNNSLSQ